MTPEARASEARVLAATVRAFPVDWFIQDEWRMLRQGLGDVLALAAGVVITASIRSPWVCVPVWILMAGRMHGLGVLMHDLGHVRHLESSRWKRLLIDMCVCWPVLMNMDYYAYGHTLHHQWSNVPGKDPYFFPLNRMSRRSFALFVGFSTLFLPAWLVLRLASFPLALVLPPVRRFHVKYFTQFGAAADLANPVRLRQGERVWVWAAGPALCWWSIGAVLTALGGWKLFLWTYGTPMVLSALIGQVRLACDHVYADADTNDIVEQLAGSTNIEAPWWQELVLAPHAANFHGMHHVAPNVPNWHWKDAHERFKASGSQVYASTVYRGYGTVFAQLLREQAAWTGQGPPATHPPPFPKDAPEPGFRELPSVALESRPRPPTPPLITVPSIEAINAQAHKHAYSLDGIDWKAANRSLLFAPESMSHLYYTPLYEELSPEERLTYNQAFAEGVSEQFVFLEQVLLVRGLKSFLRLAGRGLRPEMKEGCELFIEEEDKHSAMFRRLLVEANPETYEKETFHVYRLTDSEQRFMDRSMEDPTLYLWWIWVATLFEEKTIDFHRRYQAERALIDPMYVAVHRLHCLDELRHLQMDHHFVGALWETAPAWKRELNALLLKRVMWGFAHPRRTVKAAVARLVKAHPRLLCRHEELVTAGMAVAHSRAWHEATYSRSTLPNTFALFDLHPELHTMSTVLPLYRPRPVSR